MILQEQQKQFEVFAEKQRKIMLKKGNDYANGDRLSNFKLVAKIVGISVEQVLNVFIATKAVRLGNLLSSGKLPENESVEDNLLDLANYSQILAMVGSEKTTMTGVDKTIVEADCCGNWGENGVCKCKRGISTLREEIIITRTT